jgi:hypothetical protein
VLRSASKGDIVVANPTTNTVYVLDLSVEMDNPLLTESTELGFEIAPSKIYRSEIGRHKEGEGLASVNSLGDDWKTHYDKAVATYRACLVTEFFSKSDQSLKTMADYYQKKTQDTLRTHEAAGVLRYRVGSDGKTQEQELPLVAVLFTRLGCSP